MNLANVSCFAKKAIAGVPMIGVSLFVSVQSAMAATSTVGGSGEMTISGMKSYIEAGLQNVWGLVYDALYAGGALSIIKGIYMLYNQRRGQGGESAGHAWWWIFGGGALLAAPVIISSVGSIFSGSAINAPSFSAGE